MKSAIFIGFGAVLVAGLVYLAKPSAFLTASPHRDLHALIDLKEPAWPLVQQWIAESKTKVEVLPAVLVARQNALLATQVTTRSPMGAVIYETGGLLVDSGWLRILGADSAKMKRSLPEWNKTLFPELWDQPSPPPLVIVADDVLGGLFALNGGLLGNDVGKLYYFAPGTLSWEPLSIGYTEFLRWAFAGQTKKFYEGTRWKTWEADVQALPGDRGFSFYPFLFAEAASLEARQRAEAPMKEICRANFKFLEQMDRKGK